MTDERTINTLHAAVRHWDANLVESQPARDARERIAEALRSGEPRKLHDALADSGEYLTEGERLAAVTISDCRVKQDMGLF